MKKTSKSFQDYIYDQARINPNVTIRDIPINHVKIIRELSKPIDHVKTIRKLSKKRRINLNEKQFLNKKYNSMVGSCKQRNFNPPVFSKENFIAQYINDETFLAIFKYWKTFGCQTKHVPSFDRVNPLKTYAFNNIQVMTWEDHCIKTAIVDLRIYKDLKKAF